MFKKYGGITKKLNCFISKLRKYENLKMLYFQVFMITHIFQRSKAFSTILTFFVRPKCIKIIHIFFTFSHILAK